MGYPKRIKKTTKQRSSNSAVEQKKLGSVTKSMSRLSSFSVERRVSPGSESRRL